MDLDLRSIHIDDHARWLELYEAYLRFYEATPVPDSIQLVWDRLISGEIRSLAASVNGEIGGIAHFHIQTSTWADSGHLYLEDLFVEPASRGQGIGRALIAAVESIAKQENCGEMYWMTREGNRTARALYDSLATASDFVRYEIKLNHG
jgi:GNAT superfamily N-acetyltransferase